MRIALLTLFSLVSCFLFGQLRFEYDENLAPASSLPRDFTTFDGRLFFVADDGFHGRQIWCHDPASEQTYLISDFSENHDVTDMGKLTVFKDALVFSGRNNERKLWRLKAGENTPEPVSIPDSLQTLNLLTATADHLYWISDVDGRRYLVQMDEESNLLEVRSLSTNYPLNLAALEGDIYVFLNGGHGIRRFSPSSGVLDTVARNTLGRQDINQYISIAVSDGKLVSFTRAGSRWRLAVYDPAVDSLFVNETAILEGHNFLTPLVSLNDRIFVHQVIQDTGTLVREYLPESDIFVRPAGLDRWQDRYHLFQEFDGKLLLSDRLSPFTSFSLPLLYDTEINEVTEGPDLGSSLDHNSPQRYGEGQMTLLNGDWYYAGAEDEFDIEPYRYQPGTDQYGQVTDIHQGTAWGIIQQIQPFVDNQILVSHIQQAYRYDPSSQEAVNLADDIPGLGWDYYSSVHPLPGYLFFGDVTYQDTFYRAIAYDSSQQLMVPVLKNDVICNGGLNKWTGPFVEWNGDIWFSTCAADSTTNKTSLLRYTPGASEPERIPLDGRVTVGAPPGHKTIILLNDRLFFITNTSFFENQFEMMTYHPQEGLQQIDSPLRPSYLVQMNGADSVAYYLARAPNNGEDITLAYQPDGRISALSVGNDSLRLLGTNAVATIPDDRRHYLLARGGSEIGIYRFDPLMDTTGKVKVFSPDIRSGFNLVHHLGKLYFTGDTRDFGTELHVLDLATNEVQRIADIRPGSLDGGAYHTLSYQERLFFEATGSFRGRELWSYRPSCFNLEISAIPSNINRPTGEASLNINDGTGPYQYLWSNGATTASLRNAAAGFYEVTVTDSRGCSGSINIWVETDGIISSTEHAEVGSIKAYPNPFHDQLQLAFSGGRNTATDFAVYSINGRRLRSGQVPGGERVNLELGSLPSGILVLVLTNETGAPVLVQKIIKQ